MNHLGLFEGIGGFSLAARWMGWQTKAWVEKNKFCQKVLAKNFPYAKGYEDIKDFNGKEWKGKIDIITGGFPCQPFSLAGRRKGEDDERYLWDENFRIICEIQPIAFIGENVSGLVSMGDGQTLEKICLDLESQNYKVQSFIIPACAVQAWHRRDRIWIIAYLDKGTKRQDGNSNGFGGEETTSLQKEKQSRNGKKFQREGRNNLQSGNGVFSDIDQIRCRKMELQREQAEREMFGSINETGEIIIGDRSIKPVIRRDLHGLSSKLDGSLTNSNKRKAALGNAIVPQVAYQIYKSINLLINSPY